MSKIDYMLALNEVTFKLGNLTITMHSNMEAHIKALANKDQEGEAKIRQDLHTVLDAILDLNVQLINLQNIGRREGYIK